MERVILHSDLNNFYASVECFLNPDLKSKYVAVCGSVEDRHGIVLAKNQAAKAMGVKTAETVWQAKKKCPQLVCVSPHFEIYRKFSEKVKNIYKDYTDLIEPFGLDECWLDVTKSRLLFGDGKTIAEKIRKRVKVETGLTVSVGVSFNKVFAKLGSDLKKPDAVTVISKENYGTLVRPLPADSMIGVGKSTGEKLKKFGIYTIGNLADTPLDFLKQHFGKNGELIWQYANGYDSSEVSHKDYREPVKSIGHGVTLKNDITDAREVKKVIFYLCNSVEKSLREKGLLASSVALCVKDSNLEKHEYRITLDFPTHSAHELTAHLFELFTQRHNPSKKVRALTVRTVNLVNQSDDIQMNFFESNEKREKAENAAYEIEKRFGKNSITYAGLLKNSNLPGSKDESE